MSTHSCLSNSYQSGVWLLQQSNNTIINIRSLARNIQIIPTDQLKSYDIVIKLKSTYCGWSGQYNWPGGLHDLVVWRPLPSPYPSPLRVSPQLARVARVRPSLGGGERGAEGSIAGHSACYWWNIGRRHNTNTNTMHPAPANTGRGFLRLRLSEHWGWSGDVTIGRD